MGAGRPSPLSPCLSTIRLRFRLQNSGNALIGVNTTQNNRIAKLKQIQKDADIFENDGNSSDDKDVTFPPLSLSAIVCGKLARGEKRKKF